MTTQHYDITIIGAGPAGLSAAGMLATQGLKCRVIEKQPHQAIEHPHDDGREIALTWRSVELLKQIGAWEYMDESAQGKICSAQVLNGNRMPKLVFSSEKTACDRLAFVVSNHAIRKALYQAIEHNPSITCSFGDGVASINTTERNAKLTLESGEQCTSRLTIAADSRFSRIRDLMGIEAETLDFNRTMIVNRMTHETDHQNIAYEWFQDDHTLAMLPLAGKQSSAVLTIPQPLVDDYMAMDDTSYCGRINTLFRYRYGPLHMLGKRHAYPLVARYAKRFYAPSFILLGDAAVGMHPVTAHGFNFGLKGVEILAHLITSNQQRGNDWAAPHVLRQYHQKLRFATRPLYHATNAIASLYTKTDPLALLVRGGLIKAGNTLPFARQLITHKLLDRAA